MDSGASGIHFFMPVVLYNCSPNQSGMSSNPFDEIFERLDRLEKLIPNDSLDEKLNNLVQMISDMKQTNEEH